MCLYFAYVLCDEQIETGINAGDGVNFVTIPESLTQNIINITQTTYIVMQAFLEYGCFKLIEVLYTNV